jgi:hypothetical protein
VNKGEVASRDTKIVIIIIKLLEDRNHVTVSVFVSIEYENCSNHTSVHETHSRSVGSMRNAWHKMCPTFAQSAGLRPITVLSRRIKRRAFIKALVKCSGIIAGGV